MRPSTTPLLLLLLLPPVLAALAGAAAPTSRAASATDADAPYLWQQPQAKRLPGGLLEWNPRPYAPPPTGQARYIDFEGGDDRNDGRSPESAWKRHPWDPKAAGEARSWEPEEAVGGVFFFKGGVVYRGALEARHSGAPGRPIVLAWLPGWGKGRPSLLGARAAEGTWIRVPKSEAPNGLPEPEKTWSLPVPGLPPLSALWERREGAYRRIPLARSPNWTLENPEDVKATWAEWERTWPAPDMPRTYKPDVVLGEFRTWAQSRLFDADRPDAYEGATVWTEYTGLMDSPYAVPLEAFDPEANAVRVAAPWTGKRRPIGNDRFYAENHPRFLDSPGEYWHDAANGLLYLRLPGDADPNEVRIELPVEATLLTIRGQSHIRVAGLDFRFQRAVQLYRRFWDEPEVDPACIKVLGSARGIEIDHCRFLDAIRPVWIEALQPDDAIDDILIADNEMRRCDYDAVEINAFADEDERAVSPIGSVAILRNDIEDVGARPRRAAHGHAIEAKYVRALTVAGNRLRFVYGAAIFLHGGKPSGNRSDAPFARLLVFENMVEDACLTNNDWGSIETWQGGPAYVFSNVSLRPHGYWHAIHQVNDDNWEEANAALSRVYPRSDYPYAAQARNVAGHFNRRGRNASSASFAYPYYNDGASKQYFFNNIGQGRSSDLDSPLLTTGGFQSVAGGFLLNLFNNVFHRFGLGVKRRGTYPSLDLILGNVFQEMGEFQLLLQSPKPEAAEPAPALPDADPSSADPGTESPSLLQAHARNVFSGPSKHFGVIKPSGRILDGLEEWRRAARSLGAAGPSGGVQAPGPALRDPDKGDFRPLPDGPAAAAAVKVFVPWPLAATVGEWHFRLLSAEPDRVIDEHWYMDPAHVDRSMYRRIPRSDLRGENIGAESYRYAPSESWIRSALTLDGTTQTLAAADAVMRNGVEWSDDGETRRISGARRRTLDMDANSFLIEAILKAPAGPEGGLAAKADESAGYELRLTGELRPQLRLLSGGGEPFVATSNNPLPADAWTHLIVEVDRERREVRFHIDGRSSEAATRGAFPEPGRSLSNRADFLVGADAAGNRRPVELDFLRLARSLLRDAHTTLEELRAWQFDGPFLRDWSGQPVTVQN